MRKGDETKQEILRIAEKLFCSAGYEATSVQSILDVLHASKGGFYHHFASKEDVLRTICSTHAIGTSERMRRLAGEIGDPLARLDRLLQEMVPLRMENLAFMSMLIPILDRPESASMRDAWQEALFSACRDVLERAVRDCREAGIIQPVANDVIRPVTALIGQCCQDVSMLILNDARARRRTQPAELIEILTTYRRSLEAILDAPFGSLTLITLEEVSAFAEEASRRVAAGSPVG